MKKLTKTKKKSKIKKKIEILFDKHLNNKILIEPRIFKTQTHFYFSNFYHVCFFSFQK